jgi:hypothetical protein
MHAAAYCGGPCHLDLIHRILISHLIAISLPREGLWIMESMDPEKANRTPP